MNYCPDSKIRWQPRCGLGLSGRGDGEDGRQPRRHRRTSWRRRRPSRTRPPRSPRSTAAASPPRRPGRTRAAGRSGRPRVRATRRRAASTTVHRRASRTPARRPRASRGRSRPSVGSRRRCRDRSGRARAGSRSPRAGPRRCQLQFWPASSERYTPPWNWMNIRSGDRAWRVPSGARTADSTPRAPPRAGSGRRCPGCPCRQVCAVILGLPHAGGGDRRPPTVRLAGPGHDRVQAQPAAARLPVLVDPVLGAARA